jgi:hypothetical protein
MDQDRQITLEDIARGIDKGLATADSQRGSALERLDTTRQAKDTSLRREHARLSSKYGSDHPRVQLIANKVAINQELRIQVAAETIRARTEMPIVDGNTWVLHGFVRDQFRQAAPNLTVALSDPSGSRLNGLGQACTGANGYFKVVSMDANAIGAGAAYVRVLSTSGGVLFADKTPLQPALGRLDYKEITLSGDAEVCVSPPEPPTSTAQAKDTWVVSGRVSDQKGKGLNQLFVSIYDADLFFDDRLGQVETDLNGYYTLSYRTQDFRDLIERKPDLYLKVLDQEETLYTSEGTIRFEAGRKETINIVIPVNKFSDTMPITYRTPSDTWIVKGTVTDLQGKPLVGYTVTIFDKDILRDDVLGVTKTNASGEYTLSYRTQDFRDAFETEPDLYLTVKQGDKTVYTSKQIWFEAGRVETIDVVVGKR